MPAHSASKSTGRDGKALVPLLSVVAVLAIGVSAAAIMLQMQERDKRVATERELMIAVSENDDLQDQLQGLQRTKADLEQELALVQGSLTKVQGELQAAVAAREALLKSVEDRQAEIDRLAKDLEQVRAERKLLATDIGDIRAERKQLTQRIEDLESVKSDLEHRVTDLSGRPTVELDKVVVSERPPTASTFASTFSPMTSMANPMGRDGEVIVVNREYGFVVMNLGKNDGLAVGQEFQVVQDTEVIARVKVEKIYDELSAAAILPNSNKDLIREGDGVRSL